MKRLFLTCLLLIIPVTCWSQQVVDSRITKVTLFTNQALVTREAQLNVKQGLNKLLIEVDAFSVDKDSLQAKILGQGKIYNVQFRKIYLERQPQKQIQELKDKIENLQLEKKQLLAKINTLAKKQRFIDNIIDFSGQQIPYEVKTDFPEISQLNNTLNFIESTTTSIAKTKTETETTLKKVQRKIVLLNKKINAIQRPSDKSKKGVSINFASNKAQKIKIQIKYIVGNCGWQPLYKVSVTSDLKAMQMQMFAQTQQTSGENWQNIELSISNISPVKGIRLPDLPTWILDIPRRAYGPRKTATGDYLGKAKLERTTASAMSPRLQEEKEAGFSYAQSKKTPISFEYDLPQQITINSSQQRTLIPLTNKKIRADFCYRTIPKINKSAFLVAKLKPDNELLAGTVNLYFNERFIGKTKLTEKKSGEEFLLNLGPDREIKIKREKITDKVDENLFAKINRQTIIHDFAYKVTAENLKNKLITLEIIDNIPVSRTDKIKVEQISLTPKPTIKDYQETKGVNLWRLKLDKGEHKEINIKFRLKYPEDQYISGL
jgi:uncharacterized protein (TIGR02231 family)